MFAFLCVIVMLMFAAFIMIWQSDEAREIGYRIWCEIREILIFAIAVILFFALIAYSIYLNLYMANRFLEWLQGLF